MQPLESNDGKSPDSDDRIQDFWARHGGPAERCGNSGEVAPGLRGWSEVYAADGYTLRCEWSRIGERQELQYVEKPPQ
jgi:hypothetical protein